METTYKSYQTLGDDNPGWKERLTTLSPLCCCFWCLVITVVLLTIFLPITFLVWIPNLIQENVDNATFEFLSVSLSNATNESVYMTASIEVSNTGGYDAVLDGFTAKAYLVGYDDSLVGTLKLPKTKIKANEGAVVTMDTPLVVQNLTNFRTFAGHVLKGYDMDLEMKGDSSIDVTLSTGSHVVTDVSISNTITMKGVLIQNAIADNMTVISADGSDTISATLDMSWSALTLSQLSLSFTDITNFIYDANNIYLGRATIDTFGVVPGYNDLTSVPITIERTGANTDSISTFFGNYLMGIDQLLTVVGPIPTVIGYEMINDTIFYEYATTVVDYGLTLQVTAKGSTDGDTIIGGIITADTQQGWEVEVDGEEYEVKGAFSSIQNTLDVDITVKDTSANLYLTSELEYGFNKSISGYQFIEHCDATSSYAHIKTGYGMYKNNPTVTNVNVSANSATSFFSIAEPVTGQYGYNTPSEVDCSLFGGAIAFDYPCCFLFITTAAICRDNPQLIANTSNELTKAFIELSVDANMTVIVDGLFEVEFSYSQDSFPLAFGTEMYQGYTEALGFNCQDVIIY